LRSHLEQAADDAGVRSVALTNTGNTFCSGADLSDPPGQSGPGSYTEVLKMLWGYPKPVVIALGGHVRAGGFGMVAVADVVLSIRSASFAFTEVRIGVAPAVIAVVCLRRMTPLAAARYFMTGERFDADEAQAAGLVSVVVDDDQLGSALDGLLLEFRRCEPNALRATRSLIRRIPEMDSESGFSYANDVSGRMFASAEAAEGIAAFRERRPPRWAT
jgi:enoyl-CoA hydratase/carnithine racemase